MSVQIIAMEDGLANAMEGSLKNTKRRLGDILHHIHWVQELQKKNKRFSENEIIQADVKQTQKRFQNLIRRRTELQALINAVEKKFDYRFVFTVDFHSSSHNARL